MKNTIKARSNTVFISRVLFWAEFAMGRDVQLPSALHADIIVSCTYESDAAICQLCTLLVNKDVDKRTEDRDP